MSTFYENPTADAICRDIGWPPMPATATKPSMGSSTSPCGRVDNSTTAEISVPPRSPGGPLSPSVCGLARWPFLPARICPTTAGLTTRSTASETSPCSSAMSLTGSSACWSWRKSPGFGTAAGKICLLFAKETIFSR